MTPSQERKFDEMYKAVISLDGKFALNDEKMNQHREIILAHEKAFISSDKRLDSLESDRNKVKGAMWFGGLFGGMGILTFVYNLFKH